jgi:hypothetical protein
LESASGTDGGYGYGGYGNYGSYGYGGYGGYGAQEGQGTAQRATVAPANESSFAADGSRPVARRLIAVTSPAGGAPFGAPLRAPTCPPCAACGASAADAGARSLLLGHRGRPAASNGLSAGGVCYCRYDAAGATWALREPACRATLLAKCGASGALLECTTLEAFYSLPQHSQEDARAAQLSDQIAAFLFVDCPPSPPCSCARLRMDGADAPGAQAQCCSDLRAHCAAPFSGLDCDEVDAFCSGASPAPARALDTVRQFVAVKTHSQDCAAPQHARAYTRLAPGGGGGAAPAAALGRPALALLQQLAGAHSGMSGRAVALLVGAACLAVGASVAGMIALIQFAMVRRQQGAHPLLSSDY